MKTKLIRTLGLLFALCLVMTAMPVNQSTLLAEPLIYRSPWEMNLGEGIQVWNYETPEHGDEDEYNYAVIPSADDADWEPAPDADIIDYSQTPSTLCDVCDCRWGGDFTYFRTFVDIASNVEVTEFTIATAGVDDGIRVTIFNSAYPAGLVVPGSYVKLGGTGTANLKDYVVSGEVNTVIITHVDDCCYHSYLDSASIVLNGEIVLVPLDIEIDIKPGGYPNSFNLNGNGVVPVAILGSASFDVNQIDISTLSFAGLDVRVKGNGSPQCSVEDVSGSNMPYGEPDGYPDLVCHFVDDPANWNPDNGAATVIGSLNDGTLFAGSDTINMVP